MKPYSGYLSDFWCLLQPYRAVYNVAIVQSSLHKGWKKLLIDKWLINVKCLVKVLVLQENERSQRQSFAINF